MQAFTKPSVRGTRDSSKLGNPYEIVVLGNEDSTLRYAISDLEFGFSLETICFSTHGAG